MDENLLTLLRKVPLTKQTATALLPLLGRYGLTGLLVLARGYLGPLADRRGDQDGRACGGTDTPPDGTKPPDGADTPPDGTKPPGRAPDPNATTGGTTKGGDLSAADSAVLGLALTKLVFELGELALHNPGLDPAGHQPDFKLDDRGHPPAMSVTHVLAAARLWQERAAKRDAAAAAQRATADATALRSARAQLQAARSERYAAAPRYSYAAPAALLRGAR
jgi:hypothetical protein